MPIYEYRCKSCGHDVEALQKVSDPPLKKCPECGKRMLTRLMSAPSFRLKGGGWYETDFKSDGEKKRNLVDSGGDGDGSGAAKDGGDAGKEAAKDASTKDAGAAKNDATPKLDAAKKGDAKPAAKAAGKPVKQEKASSKKSRRAAAD